MENNTPQENYLFLKKTYEELSDSIQYGTTPSQKWVEYHHAVVYYYRRVFPSFEKAHEGMESRDINEKMRWLDQILDSILKTYAVKHEFAVHEYRSFCEILLSVIHGIHEDDEFADMFQSISLRGETN